MKTWKSLPGKKFKRPSPRKKINFKRPFPGKKLFSKGIPAEKINLIFYFSSIIIMIDPLPVVCYCPASLTPVAAAGYSGWSPVRLEWVLFPALPPVEFGASDALGLPSLDDEE